MNDAPSHEGEHTGRTDRPPGRVVIGLGTWSAGAGARIAGIIGVAVMLAMAAACSGGVSSGGSGSSATTRPTAPTGPTGAAPPPAAIASCLRAHGGAAKLSAGAWNGQNGLPAMRAEITGNLRKVAYDIVVFRSPAAARQYLAMMIGMTGGTRTVDGVPIEQMVKRAGTVVVDYPYQPSPAVARTVEGCFGGHAEFDPDLLAQLGPVPGCGGAAGKAIDELTPPAGASAWKPERVEGGGCVVRFTTTQPTATLVSDLHAQLSAHGWMSMHTSGPLLTMWRGSLAATVEEVQGQYNLYIRSLEYLE